MSRTRLHSHRLIATLVGIGLLSFSIAIPSFVHARSIIWNGGGADTKWATTANWSGSTVPGAGDTAVFSNVSIKNATIPANTTVGGITIHSTYTGTISQSGGSVLIVGTGSFVQGGGTFKGGSGSSIINGSLTLSGGTLVAPGHALSVLTSFLHTGGSFMPNSGTLNLTTSGSQTLTPGGVGFGNLQLEDYGLIGHWRFDEASGITAKDTSGFGYDGTLTGTGISFSSTKASVSFTNSGSVHLNGIGDHVLIHSLLGQPGNVSISLWMNMPADPGTPVFRDLFCMGSYICIRYQTDASLTALYYHSPWSFTNNVYTTPTFVGTGWHHIVFTVKSGEQKLYADGTLYRGSGWGGNIVYSGYGSDTYIGCTNGGSLCFPGYIDDVRVYNRILSATEVARLAAGYSSGMLPGTITLAGNLSLSGSLTLNAGTLDVSSSNYTISLSGSLINNGGTLLPRSGLVLLNGINQSISGSWTLNNLTKAITAADTLTIAAGSSLTINGSTAFTGTSNGILTIKSGTSGTSWSIKPTASHTFDYLALSDSVNFYWDILQCTHCSDGGGNSRWEFPVASSSATTNTSAPPSGGGGGGGSRIYYAPTSSSLSVSSSSSSSNFPTATSSSRSSVPAQTQPFTAQPSFPLGTLLHNTNFRTSPSTNSPIITVLLKDWQVSVLSTEGQWSHVETLISHTQGYLFSPNLSLSAPLLPSVPHSSDSSSSAASSGVHTLTALNVHADADMASKTIAQLPKDAPVTILQTIGAWFEILFDNARKGYVVSRWVK